MEASTASENGRGAVVVVAAGDGRLQMPQGDKGLLLRAQGVCGECICLPEHHYAWS
uniref:Uncharacterized protein n=1 Tax=Oryza barthii TaxID=65489 RepID=A0A0D3GGG5_9ORYZ